MLQLKTVFGSRNIYLATLGMLAILVASLHFFRFIFFVLCFGKKQLSEI